MKVTVFVLKSGGYLFDNGHRGILYTTNIKAFLAALDLFANGLMELDELNKIVI